MYPYYVPPVDVEKMRENFTPPEDRLDDLERDRAGKPEPEFDAESASYMDKEGVIIAEKRTDYAPDQTGCGCKFSSEAPKGRNGDC